MKKLFLNSSLFRIVVPVLYGILAYLLILLINNELSQISAIFTTQEVYVSIALTYLVFESSRLTLLLIDRYFPVSNGEGLRLGIQLIVILTVNLLLITLAISSYFTYVLQFSISKPQLILFNIIYGATTVLYIIMYSSNHYLYRQNLEKLEQEKMLKQGLEKDMRQFKNEINPFLLYECLENVITLLNQDPEAAEDYIDRLSMVYRYILSHRGTEIVPYQDDLKAAQNLVGLLNFNFDHQIKLHHDQTAAWNGIQVVPGTLPGIVEGILRNSIVTKNTPLEIYITIEEKEGYIIIQNKLNERLVLNDFYSKNFESIQHSYTYYTEKPLVKVKAYDYSYVKVPVLSLEQEPMNG